MIDDYLVFVGETKDLDDMWAKMRVARAEKIVSMLSDADRELLQTASTEFEVLDYVLSSEALSLQLTWIVWSPCLALEILTAHLQRALADSYKLNPQKVHLEKYLANALENDLGL
ncbi:hypothetical protein ACTUVN_002365 [Pseudomonas caspiana]